MDTIMTTNPLCEQVTDYFYRELTPEETAVFEPHLANCAACSKALAELKQLSLLVKSAAPEIDAAVAARIRATISAGTAGKASWQRRILSAPVLAGFSLALTGAAMLFFWQGSLERPVVIPPINLQQSPATSQPAPVQPSPQPSSGAELRDQASAEKLAQEPTVSRKGVGTNALASHTTTIAPVIRETEKKSDAREHAKLARAANQTNDLDSEAASTRGAAEPRAEGRPAKKELSRQAAAPPLEQTDESKAVAGAFAPPPAAAAKPEPEGRLAAPPTAVEARRKQRQAVVCAAEFAHEPLSAFKSATLPVAQSCRASLPRYRAFIQAHPELSECLMRLPCYPEWSKPKPSK